MMRKLKTRIRKVRPKGDGKHQKIAVDFPGRKLDRGKSVMTDSGNIRTVEKMLAEFRGTLKIDSLTKW